MFFDFLGLYFIHYSEETGQLLNYSIAGATIVLIVLSMSRMAVVSGISLCSVICCLCLVQIVQLISLILAFVFPIVVEYVMDSLGHSLTYYSTPLLVIGLYVCPSLIGLSLPTTIYCSIQRNVSII